MFKSQVPLQTPIAIKVLLLSAIAIFVVGWSSASDASEGELNSVKQTVAANRQDKELDNLLQKVHQQINQYRQTQNLEPLKLNSVLSQQAQIHSQNMADGKVKFSHNGFETRVENIDKKIAYRSVAENVGYNQGYQDPASQVVAGWNDSPGHQKNIVGNYNLTGLGVAKNQQGEYYFTQLFILEK